MDHAREHLWKCYPDDCSQQVKGRTEWEQMMECWGEAAHIGILITSQTPIHSALIKTKAVCDCNLSFIASFKDIDILDNNESSFCITIDKGRIT